MRAARTVIALALVALGFAAGAGWSALRGPRGSKPRAVAPRGPLNAEEQSVTQLFERSSPSVVFITSIALRRDFFRLNVMVPLLF